jgi:hypothetical protein
VLRDLERYRDGVRRTATVLLTGAECPFRCVFCDLWRYTLEGPTPAGALPAQLEAALEGLEGGCDQIKLYNASNFFERRAVPPEDDAALVRLLEPFAWVTVECHPRLVLGRAGWRRCSRFASGLRGRLEVAMGLETAHPTALRRLDKDLDLETFRRACGRLVDADIAVRVFVLVGVPFVPLGEREDWVERSVELALAEGAALVSLIPVRDREGRLAHRTEWSPPDLELLERCLERCSSLEERYRRGAVALDVWDLDAVAAGCLACAPSRRRRLVEWNGSGRASAPVVCAECRVAGVAP